MDRALCPVLIGREEEIGTLEDALLEANRGRGQVVLIAGDAGMGKTRLASEIERRARTLGMEVVVGGCSEAEMALPYLPFIEAVGNFLATRDLNQIRSELGPVRRELAHLFPQLEPDTLTPDVDSAQGRLRLFEAILGLIAIPAREQGLLIVVEDLHWSDASTRELLDFLTRRLRSSRILVVGTYRRDEMHRRHPLVAMIQAWRRSNAATLVELDPLTPDRVAAMVRAIFDLTDVQDDTRDFLHSRSEGNPFVLEELLKAALDRGDIFRDGEGWSRRKLAEIRIPESVRETILLRLDKLTSDQVDVLRAASVLGSSFTYSTLVELSGFNDALVAAAVETCVQQQLLQDDPVKRGRFRFRHALTREAISDDMIAPVRERLHSRAADLLARSGAPPVEITHQLLAGGRAAEAVPICLQAAAEAEAAYAQKDAIELYLRALPHVTEPRKRAEVLCNLGVAAHNSGQVSMAQDYLREGLSELSDPNGPEAARYRLTLGRCYWESNRADLALLEYERARSVLAAAGPSSSLAIAYVRLAGLRLFNFDAAACFELAQRGRAIAEEAGDRGVAIWANSFIGGALAGLDQVDAAIELIDRSFEEAHSEGFPIWAENALYNGCALRFGNWRVLEVWDRIKLATPFLTSSMADGNWTSITGGCLLIEGRAGEAYEAYRRAEALYREGGIERQLSRARLLAAEALVELDRLPEAREFAPASDPNLEQQDKMPEIAFQLHLATAAGDAAGIRLAAARVAEAGTWPVGPRGRVGTLAVDALVQLGDLAEAEAVAEVVGDLGPARQAPLQFIEARLRAGRGDHRGAVPLLAAAAEFLEAVHHRNLAWTARIRLAQSLAAMDDAAGARRELETVLAMASELGNPLTARRAREAMVELGLEDSRTPGEAAVAQELSQPVAVPLPAGERLVSVLFADVRGYTAAAGAGIPAEVADRIGTLQRWATREVERRHGVIDKFAGDAIMATFNVSGASIDHAVHALQAGLAIRDKAAAQALRLGIGVATGPAVVGNLAGGANLSVLGPATNLAARLQARAEGGEILVDEEVMKRIRGWLATAGLTVIEETLELKGIAEPVKVYRLR